MLSTPTVSTQRPPNTIKAPGIKAREQFLSGLKILYPSSVVFSSCEPLSNCQTTCAVTHKLSSPLFSLFSKKFQKLTVDELFQQHLLHSLSLYHHCLSLFLHSPSLCHHCHYVSWFQVCFITALAATNAFITLIDLVYSIYANSSSPFNHKRLNIHLS